MSYKKFTIPEVAELIKYLKDESLSLKDVANKMGRSVPSIQQKLTEIAVDRIKRGADPEEVKRDLRARDEDIELLMNIENPHIVRAKELLHELIDVMNRIR